ncbi:MAG: 2,3-bisphosphoglycerate-independent phosphoglycerate mutase, partial [Dokdonella sp.]
MLRPKPVLLLILDGWGHRVEREHNAIALAELPNWRALLATHPHALVDTHGLSVGLPAGQMGNSEVGHMNIGAGRVVYQDLTRIDAAIADGSFARNAALLKACHAVGVGGTLHLLGLLSPGGVHSHEDHILAMLDLAHTAGVAHVAVHAFLDGRDTPPRSAGASLERLAARCRSLGNARIATVSGRYYAMDRDHRWDRVKLAWDAIVDADAALHAPNAISALTSAYAREENDEFVLPTVIDGGARIADDDAVVFMNFRADRARQLTHGFVDATFN